MSLVGQDPTYYPTIGRDLWSDILCLYILRLNLALVYSYWLDTIVSFDVIR